MNKKEYLCEKYPLCYSYWRKLKWIQVLESEKQKNDIINLLDVFYIDMEYIKDWCEQLHLKTYPLL